MAEDLTIDRSLGKADIYQSLIPQIKALIDGENNLVGSLANISAALHTAFGHLWIGFYRVEGEELLLGPFQGPVACGRIAYGKGVCGKAWEEGKTIIVEDVEQFPGHIACSSLSRSEIVVPIFNKSGKVALVLDIDSENLATFNQTDKQYLEELAAIIGETL